MTNKRSSFLRALILAAIAVPAAGCGGETESDTGSTSAGGAGGAGGSTAGSGGSAAGSGGAGSGGTAAGSGGSGTSGQGGAGGSVAGSGGTSTAGGAGGSGAGAGGSGAGAGGSGGSGQGGSAAGEAGSGGSGGGGAKFPCVDSKPIVVDGKPTGYESCASGAIHRRDVLECPTLLPRAEACPQVMEGSTCKQDSDCKDAPNGFCVGSQGGFEAPGCYCNYGCTKDADCGAGSVCLCGDPVGKCVAATCTSDAGCGQGTCSTYGIDQVCYTFGFACQNEADQCGGNADCAAPDLCLVEGDHRICKPDQPCAIGRPLVIEQGWRFAALTARAGWCLAADGARV